MRCSSALSARHHACMAWRSAWANLSCIEDTVTDVDGFYCVFYLCTDAVRQLHIALDHIRGVHFLIAGLQDHCVYTASKTLAYNGQVFPLCAIM